MGAECAPTICQPQEPQLEINIGSFNFEYGEDFGQSLSEHKDSIICRAPQCQRNLKHCQQCLRQTGRLYKDPSINTEPITLRSLSQSQSQLRCTFQRPHVFLHDPSDPTKGKSRIYKIVDVNDSSPSQIIIRDEVMQPFGVFLCFLAEHPQLINKIIQTDPNSYGICVVKMNINSKKQFIYIDDYILCTEKVPLFSQPIKAIYMWPCLIEKAWFKVKGFINNKIQKNNPAEIFKSFLSYPVASFRFVEGDQQYNRNLIEKYLYQGSNEKGYVLNSKAAPYHKIGLSGKKYFYLIKIVQFQGKKLFYIRNPCPNFDFRGSYRFLSEQLQSLLRQQTSQFRIHSGNFILDQSQLLQQIQSFTIIQFNKHSQDIIEQSLSLVVNQENYLMMDLKNDSLVSMAFNQYPYKDVDIRPLPLSFFVVLIKDNVLISDLDNQAATFGVQTTVFFKQTYKQLKAGHYLIRLKKRQLNLKKVKKYSQADRIVVTSQSKLKFDYKQMALFEKYFKDYLLAMGKQKMKQKIIYQKQQLTHIGVQFVDYWLGDLAIVYLENTSKTKKAVRVQVKFINIKNLECTSHALTTQFNALEPILENHILIFEKIVLSESASLGQFIIDTF